MFTIPYYEILETPGKKRVYPLDGDAPIKTQDEAKIVVARLRAEARAEGRKVDFVMRRDSERQPTTPTSQATSVRLSEENRRRVARFCGRMMMQSGDPITMGDAVARLVDHYDKTANLVDDNGNINEVAIITLAREIRARQKAAS